MPPPSLLLPLSSPRSLTSSQASLLPQPPLLTATLTYSLECKPPQLQLLDLGLLPPRPPPAMMQQPPPLLMQAQGPPSLPTTSALPTKPAPALGSTWADMGALNNSLLNFSLSTGPSNKAASVPMNAIKAQPAFSVPKQSNGTNNNMAVGGFSGLDGLL